VHVVGRTPRRNYDVLCGYRIGTTEHAEETQETPWNLEDMKSLLQAWPAQHDSFH
jgi:hypothetical protein